MQDFHAVTKILSDYFAGLHHADTKLLRRICCPELVLRGPNIKRPLNDWLNLVGSRPVPAQLNHAYQYKILSLDIVAEQAMAKLACPLLGHDYVDFIGLWKENQRWKIISKMYCEL